MVKKADFNIPLSGIVYREGKWWIAHCLELDLVAEGHTANEAIRDCLKLAVFQIQTAFEEGDVPSIFKPAPADVWYLYAKGQKSTRRKAPPPISEFSVRTLVLA